MVSCEFCEISHNTFFKKPFRRLLQHKHEFGLLTHHDLLFFQKRCHTHFPAKYFLDLIYRLGTRASSIFQTLSQTPTTPWNTCDGAFFSKIVNSLKSRTLTFQKFFFNFLQWKPFKNDEKCFLFHLKSSFRSQDIWVFVLTFWSWEETA